MKQNSEVYVVRVVENEDADVHEEVVDLHSKRGGIRRSPWVKYVLLSTIVAVSFASILTAQHFKKLREDYFEHFADQGLLNTIEIDRSAGNEKRPKGEVINQEFNSGVATNDQLKEAAEVEYTGASGIAYTFGVEGTDIEDGLYNGDEDLVSIALNPMAESDRRVGFFFMPNYGSMESAITGDKYTEEQLKFATVAGFGQLNKQQAFNVRFQNNTNPGGYITFFRGDHLYYTTDSWDCFVMSIDLDTQEILDTMTLHIQELDSEGEPIEFDDTSLSGWWRVTGIEAYESDQVGGMECVDLGNAAITQHNSAVNVTSDTFARLDEFGGFPVLPKADDYFVHQLRSSGYAPLILKYDAENKMPTPAVISTNALIAITPKYKARDSSVPLITLYGYLNLGADGKARFVYLGYTDYNDSRCVSLEEFTDIKLRWE